MGTYIILSRRTPEGNKALRAHPEGMLDIVNAVTALEGKVLDQYYLLGEQDFCTIASLPDNAAAHLLAGQTPAGRERTILPAIDLNLFVRLLGQSTETVGPYGWQASRWADLIRPGLWWWEMGRTMRKYMQPFQVIGGEHLRGLNNPVIVIGNHTSHMDTIAMWYALPFRLRWKLFFGGAADRWFLKDAKGIRRQGWYSSLQGTFPIKRGGGSASLDYPKWLIDRGASIAIFPEGTRSRSGKLGRFRYGPAILAVSKQVPVIPMYFEGLGAIRPVGSRELKPGPVTALIGEPIRFTPNTDIPEATHTLHRAVEALRQKVHMRHSERPRPALAAAD